MSPHRTLKVWFAAALGGAPVTLLAGGLRLLSQDGFATARGEAFVATADNPSAIYYNPAGITQLSGSNLRGGLYGIYYDPTFRPPPDAQNSGTTYHLRKNEAAAAQFFLTHSLTNSPLSFGLGVYAPFGASGEWPQDTGFRSVAISGDLKYFTINPVLALKLAPSFSIAAGMTADYAQLQMEQGLRAFNTSPNRFRFTGHGWSVGYNLGTLWQPHEKLSIGASFRSEADLTFDGHTDIEQFPVIPSTHLPARSEFKFPWNVVAGLSFRPTPKWNFEFDADYTEWSSFGIITIKQAGPPPFPVQQDIPVTLNWRPSWAYKFGATRYFDNHWHLSAGYVFSENSVPDAYYTPLAADMDRHFFSIGVGRQGRRFDFDLTYQCGYGAAHTVKGSTPSSTPGQFAGQTADGRYDFISHAFLASVGVRF